MLEKNGVDSTTLENVNKKMYERKLLDFATFQVENLNSYEAFYRSINPSETFNFKFYTDYFTSISIRL